MTGKNYIRLVSENRAGFIHYYIIMKKIITFSVALVATTILAGCNLFGGKEKPIEVVDLDATSVEEAKALCLSMPNHQWNDLSQECEKPNDKTICLQA